MCSRGRANLPFLLSKEPRPALLPGQTGQGPSRLVAGDAADCASTGGSDTTVAAVIATVGTGTTVGPSFRTAITDRRRHATSLRAVVIPIVVPAIGVHDIRTGVTGTPRTSAAAVTVLPLYRYSRCPYLIHV